MSCPFCPPQVDDQPTPLENESSLFIDLKHPVLQGSGVIVPRAHRPSVFDLTQEEIASAFSLLAEVRSFLDGEHEPQGYNVGWNCGAVAGQTVFHAHLHVIPRYAGEPYAGKGIRHWLKQEANRRT